jgi:hypothetical protein
MYENRQFAIFSTTELPLINFSEVLEVLSGEEWVGVLEDI